MKGPGSRGPAPKPPAAPAPPPPRFDLAVGVTGTVFRLTHDRGSVPVTASLTRGLTLSGAFYPIPQIALVGEAWWHWNAFEHCDATAPCTNYLVQNHTQLTLGLRLPLARGFALQAMAGTAHYELATLSPVFTGIVLWRVPAKYFDIGFEARFTSLDDDLSSMQGLGGNTTISKSW